jgi:hypothetical protein
MNIGKSIRIPGGREMVAIDTKIIERRCFSFLKKYHAVNVEKRKRPSL